MKIKQPMEVSSPREPTPEAGLWSLPGSEAGLRQIPIFPVPVRSSGSFLIYALCLQAIESGLYADRPAMLPHLQTIKSVMEQEYVRFGISMYEYRQFVIAKNQATNIEEVLARANITWEALLNLVNQRVETEFVEEHLVEKRITGEEENVEMGTE